MGAEYIGGGLTVEKTKEIEDIRAVVESFREEIERRIDEIDYAGLYAPEFGMDVVEAIADGVAFIDVGRTGGRDTVAWDVPGNSSVFFLTFGGLSWGDSPFEEYDSVCVAGDAALAIPEFGRAVGILGGGIRVDYADAECPQHLTMRGKDQAHYCLTCHAKVEQD